MTSHHPVPASHTPTARPPMSAIATSEPVSPAEQERAVDYILDDCFFAVGQVVGTRKTVDYDAVLWWRDHYRAKFVRAIRAFGNRWQADRQNVTGVALMFGERAVRHAGESASIDLSAFQKAAADVERYCQLHASRRARRCAGPSDSIERPLMVGYWCTH